MIINFSQIDFPLLTNVINNINETLACPKFQEHSALIEIDTWENVKQVMKTSKNVAEKGFAFCISNYCDSGVFKRIIIINLENCDLLELSEREITAIIYHELGHLLNSFEFIEEPTIMYCLKNGIEYNITSYEEIHTNNSTQNELYADSYANQYGYGLELISTFIKYNEHFDDEIGHFETRVKGINNNELMQGNVKPINKNGW